MMSMVMRIKNMCVFFCEHVQFDFFIVQFEGLSSICGGVLDMLNSLMLHIRELNRIKKYYGVYVCLECNYVRLLLFYVFL